MKSSFIYKFLLITISGLMAANAWGQPVPSGELFATYQKQGDRFYKGGNEANLEAEYFDWNVSYYIVSCGDSILLRATTTEDRNFTAGWQTQLRLWTNTWGTGNEIQTNAGGDTKNCYTSESRHINYAVNDIKFQFFVNWEGNCVTQTYDYNRASINNPIDDNVAPSINPNDVTMAEVDGNLVFTFGAVTADDEYFYYVGDADHHIGSVSLGNKVYITKPTFEDGTTYKFRCYAVDYNGNKSAYKEFTLAMPFDGNLNMALNKAASAGAVQNDNVAAKAVDGNTGTSWTSFGQGSEGDWWWKVDLGNVYDVTEIKIVFQDCWNTYSVYRSVDELNWTAVVENEPSASSQTKDYTSLNFAGRYLKVVSSVNQIGIKEFEVYASGLAAVDATNPTVSASCTASTINTATLRIIAADEDDAGNAGTINSIKVSDVANEFAEQEVLGSLVSNEITLSGLTYNTTYHFTVTVSDLAGNTASTTVEVVLPFNTELDIARNKPCEAGTSQGANTPEKAVNGNPDNFWTCFGQGEDASDWWWRVDLGEAYDVTRIFIHFNDVWGAYSIYHSLDGADWSPMVEGETAENNTSKTYSPLAFSARYLKVTSVQSQIGIREFEVYASGFAVADAINPTVSASCTASTINSATLRIIAADEDDAGNAGTINSIKVSDTSNGFAEQEVLSSLVGNEITLSGLTYNTTYNFTVLVSDLAGNTASTTVEVVLPFNDNLDIARGKSCTAGAVQNANTPEKAVNGNPDNFWTCFGQGEDASNWWWRVDLGNSYNITEIKIHFNDEWEKYSIYSSFDDAMWTPVVEEQKDNNNSTRTYSALTFSGRYLKVTSVGSHLGIREFEVYASGFAPICLNETNNTNILSINNGSLVTVVLPRSFANPEEWYTLCLPFDMSEAQMTATFGAGYTLATLTGSEDRGSLIHLNFDYVRALEAGKPYLLKPGANTVNPTISGVTIQNITPIEITSTYMNFQGVFNATTLDQENQRFVGAQNYLYSPRDGGTPMGAFRCYFTIPEQQQNNVAGRQARIVFGEQTATDITNIEGQDSPVKFMQNGVLYIVRDGRTYNAQGILVK